ncbi:MAG TPA: hypothetical protein PLE30_01470 [Candidatus Kapabacteria bacterium]|nr:hypothetical protein [Candidatus Kapabacteria bacterium]
MKIEIIEIIDKKGISEFVNFQIQHYKGNKYFIPPMIHDEIETFTRDKNPAFADCEANFFVAKMNNKIVGRIVAINNKAANKKYNTKNIRFSWFETINDYHVAELLLNRVKQYALDLGMESISGPHGFCDFDPQGMLVEGFDTLGTIAGIYNYPYYNDFITKFGFKKDIDYLEFLSTPPYKEGIPEKILNMAAWAKKRYGYKIIEYDSSKEYIKHGTEIFELLNESFANNYGTVPLSKQQIDYYIKKYISYIHKKLIKLVANNEGKLVGFMITMPSLSLAYQKSKGKLFPFGFVHLMRALKTYNTLDFYLAGVKKEYQGKGVDLIMVVEIVKSAMELGFQYAESNQELENNTKVHSEWKFFNPVQHKRRRIYKFNLVD